MDRALSYLRSGKNLVGLALALVGYLLHLTGLFGPFWPLAVVGLYAIGALITPRRRPKPLKAEAFDPQQVRRSLDHAYQMTHGRLPPDVQSKVARIRTEILELLPHTSEFPTGSQDLFVLQRTATDYLPGTIQAYLALPADYATTRKVQGDKTPLQLLKEQLEVLDTQMDEITEAVRQRDSDKLMIQGRFLEERFGSPSSGLGLPPGGSGPGA